MKFICAAMIIMVCSGCFSTRHTYDDLTGRHTKTVYFSFDLSNNGIELYTTEEAPAEYTTLHPVPPEEKIIEKGE